MFTEEDPHTSKSLHRFPETPDHVRLIIHESGDNRTGEGNLSGFDGFARLVYL